MNGFIEVILENRQSVSLCISEIVSLYQCQFGRGTIITLRSGAEYFCIDSYESVKRCIATAKEGKE